MSHRSPMPPPSVRHPDRRQDVLEDAHRAEAFGAHPIPGSLTWLKRRCARLESLLTEAAQFLDSGDPSEDMLSERIYEALSARRGE